MFIVQRSKRESCFSLDFVEQCEKIDAIRSSAVSTFPLTPIIHSLYDLSEIENTDLLLMNCFSTVRVDAVSFPTESRISVNTATDGDENHSISPSSLEKQQLDPKDSDEVK